MNTQFTTPTGSRFTVGPCRSSLVKVISPDGKGKVYDPAARLTGRFEVANIQPNGELDVMLEVSHSFGTTMILEEFIFQ